MPSQLRTCSDSSVRVSMASPNRIRNLDAQQSTSIRSLQQDSKCFGGINVMNEGKELPANCCTDKLNTEEDVGICHTSYCKDSSQSSASRKQVMQTISEKQFYCATTVHNERSWADNAWRARLVQAISQRGYVLPNSEVNAQSPSSFGNFGNAGNVPCKLTSSLGNNTNGNHQDQVMQENHNDNPQDQAMQEKCKYESLLDRCESASGVNLVSRCEPAFGVNSVERYASTSGVNSTKLDKGKEKVTHDKNNCVSNTKESDDSNESMESCPSTQAPKREYAQCFTSEMSSQNKRYRREYDESSCSGLMHKNGSSFFNWMSSLTNGSEVLDKTIPAISLDKNFSAATEQEFAEHSVPPQNNGSIPLQSVGFNSHFQSLYCRNIMITSRNAYRQSDRNCTEHEAGRETLNVANVNLDVDSLQMNSGGRRGDFRNQIGVFPLIAGRNLEMANTSKSCVRSVEEKQNKCHSSSMNAATGIRGIFTESLWVSRFLPKTSMKLIDATPCNIRNDFCAVNTKDVDDKLYSSAQQKLNMNKEHNSSHNFTSTGSDNGTSSKCPAISPDEHNQSETMASILARRLDALRRAKTSCDHGISKRNHRTGSFVVGCSSHDGLEAVEETHKSSSGDGKLVLWLGDKGKEQLCTGSDEELRGKDFSRNEQQHCGGSTAGKAACHDKLEENTSAEDASRKGIKIKEVVSNSMEILPDNKQIVPYGMLPSDVCDQASVIFGALQRLRLSRSEIIRWLKSPVMHTTLDGFYLRLRFGKWEEALGGTGYHVARINGALDRNHLSVTIRNSTCQVDSRFVSNHDFQEDELKSWYAAIKGGGKLPSNEELGKKLRERELLHFQNVTSQHNCT